jgi:hypothetical protein
MASIIAHHGHRSDSEIARITTYGLNMTLIFMALYALLVGIVAYRWTHKEA